MPFDGSLGFTKRGLPRSRPPRPGEGGRVLPITDEERRIKGQVKSMILQRLACARRRGLKDESQLQAHRSDWKDAPIALLCCELLIERQVRRERLNANAPSDS